jgi:hypothetical protein
VKNASPPNMGVSREQLRNSGHMIRNVTALKKEIVAEGAMAFYFEKARDRFVARQPHLSRLAAQNKFRAVRQ